MASNSKEYQEKNYKKYWWSKKTMKKRAARNTARNRMIAAWKVKKWDWKHIDHIKPLSSWGTNSPKNLRVRSAKANMRDWAKIANNIKKKKK